MISIVTQISPPLCAPNASNTQGTDNLLYDDEFLDEDQMSEAESESSSICHSPTWDDISGRKGRNEKRERKRREKELEKERGIKTIAMKPTKSEVKPKKLSKLPPIIRPRPINSSSRNRTGLLNTNSCVQHEGNVNLPALETTTPRKDLYFPKNSTVSINSSSTSNNPQTTDIQTSRGFIGGLKLRKVEEANVQEAIRQIKIRNREKIRFLSQQDPTAPEDYERSVAFSRRRSPLRDESEWLSRPRDTPFSSRHGISSSLQQGLTGAKDYFTMSKNLKNSQREQLMDQVYLDESTEKVPGNKLAANLTPIENCRQLNCEMSVSNIDSACSQGQSTQTKACNPNTRELDNQTCYPYPDMTTFETNLQTSRKKISVFQRRQSSVLNPTPGLMLRPIIKQPLQRAKETSSEPFSSLSEKKESNPHHNVLFQPSNSTANTGITANTYIHDSTHSYSDIILDCANLRNDFSSAECSPKCAKVMNDHCEINSAPSPVEMTQKIKRSFDSSNSVNQLNPGSRFSHAKSTASSEGYYSPDDFSNITTPTESRPNSFKDGSLDEPKFEAQSVEVAKVTGQMKLESRIEDDTMCKQVNENQIKEQDDNYEIPHIIANQSNIPAQEDIQPTRVMPLRIIKGQGQQSISPENQDPPVLTHERPQALSWPLHETEEGLVPLRGLIKRPLKTEEAAVKSPNADIKSDVSNYSQHLQEARLRIRSDTSSPWPPRSVSKLASSHPPLSAPFAKMFVICCSCKYFHDMPSKLYACMAKPDDLVTEQNLGVSGVITTSVRCPWCGHGMSTSCCAGYAAVVYMKERLH